MSLITRFLPLLFVLALACTRTAESPPPMQHTSAPTPPAAPTQSLVISLAQGSRPGIVAIQLTNAGAATVSVFSHVEASRVLLTWYRLDVTGPSGPRRLALGGPANEAAAITVDLAPGKSLTHEVDLQAAALEPHNGAARLSPGTYQITATYAVSEPGEHWTGSISSAPLTVVLR